MEKTINLFRKSDDRTQTLGELECEGLLLYSMELPWRDNQVGISCIPVGEYEIVKHNSPRFGPCYWVKEVPGRSEILIHPANFVRQLRGCIAPGLSMADIDGDGNIDVTSSKAAMSQLLELDAVKLKVW